MNEMYRQEEAFLKLKTVCSEEGLDKYKNVNADRLDMMFQILCIGHKNITAKEAYDYSPFGYEVLQIISDDQWKCTESIRSELLELAKERFLCTLAKEFRIIRLLDWIVKKLNGSKRDRKAIKR